MNPTEQSFSIHSKSSISSTNYSNFILPSQSKSIQQSIQSFHILKTILDSRITSVEIRLPLIIKLTNECIQTSQKFFQNSKFPQILKLFRSYIRIWIGLKDEIMILLNGQLIRSYHISMNEFFIHERNDEKHYYHSKCSLTSCCIDGLDYEFRKICKRFGDREVCLLLISLVFLFFCSVFSFLFLILSVSVDCCLQIFPHFTTALISSSLPSLTFVAITGI